jgi:CubicO group peptidase (beta-lactamase class C family)
MILTRREFGLTAFAATRFRVSAAPLVFPSHEWQSAAPESAGMAAESLRELARNLGGRGCVVKHGFVLHEWGSQSEIGDWASSAKPVLSTLLWFAIAEGKVKDVDVRVRDLGWNLELKDQTMTLRHLANMVSGYARPEAPGAAWAYNDYAIQLYQQTLFDRIFREAPEAASMHPSRLGALHLQDGLHFRATNRRLSASVRDFARIGWLWLNKGRWGDRQVLPRRFFDRYQKPQVPRDLPHTAKAETRDYLGIGTYGGGSDHFTEYGPGIYGFNWWFNSTGRLHPKSRTWPDAPRDAFMSIGVRGNCALMIPSRQLMVVCANGNWGGMQAGNPAWTTNQHIRLLVSSDRSR